METTADNFASRDWKYWTTPEVIDIAGVPTAYRRGGEGPTTVYLHGGGGTRGWNPFHIEMAKHVDLIAPEHPGFGDTPRPPHMDRWEDWVLHYEAFFEELELKEIHLVATSFGAWLAAHLAIYYPNRFASLTLVTPLGLRINDEPLFDIFRVSPEDGLARLLNGRGEDHADQLVQESELEDGLHAFAEDSTAALLMWNPRYEIKFDHRLGRIKAPTLVLAAEDDRVVGNEQAPGFARLIGGSKLQTLTGPDGLPSSHGMLIDQPAEAAAQISGHINASMPATALAL